MHSAALVGAFLIIIASEFIRVRSLFSLNPATITAAGEMPRLLVLGHTWQVSAKPREMWIPHRVSITEASHPSLTSLLAHILIEALQIYNSYLRTAHLRYRGGSGSALVYLQSPDISTSKKCICSIEVGLDSFIFPSSRSTDDRCCIFASSRIQIDFTRWGPISAESLSTGCHSYVPSGSDTHVIITPE